MLADLRCSVRLLRNSPGMTSVAIISLGLGIGASTTVYSVIHGVTMRAYAFEDANRLAALWELPISGVLGIMTRASRASSNGVAQTAVLPA